MRSPPWSWTRTSQSRLQSWQTLLKDLQQLRKNKIVILICCFFLSILIFYKYLFNFFISEATTDEKHDSLSINQETPYDITQVPFPLGNLELKTFLNKELEKKICRKIVVTVYLRKLEAELRKLEVYLRKLEVYLRKLEEKNMQKNCSDSLLKKIFKRRFF